MGASDGSELRVNVDDLKATAARYEVSAAELTKGTPAGTSLACQPSAAAVQAMRAAAVMTRATLSARAASTGAGIAAADANYVENEAESAAQVRALA